LILRLLLLEQVQLLLEQVRHHSHHLRLAQVLRVIEALGGEFSLNGLPAAALAAEPKREGHDDGA
jgi:hypothetical protein